MHAGEAPEQFQRETACFLLSYIANTVFHILHNHMQKEHNLNALFTELHKMPTPMGQKFCERTSNSMGGYCKSTTRAGKLEFAHLSFRRNLPHELTRLRSNLVCKASFRKTLQSYCDLMICSETSTTLRQW